MIHKAARDMAIERYGDEGWRAILAKSGLGAEHFISARSYPDETTFRLFAAAADHGRLAFEEFLEAFGRFWIRYAGRSAYASILDRTGADLVSFLGNLDRMHASIRTVIGGALLPTFALVKATESEVEVSYRSSRNGLEPFVAGMLKGLLDRFGETGRVAWRRDGEASLFRIARGHA
ncbi:MAG: heme NO-binding domain-containing protein [Pseudomonadota bacterium]|nr:heme NO-binding domain-containing protein [Pseudomonadota bacterium]